MGSWRRHTLARFRRTLEWRVKGAYLRGQGLQGIPWSGGGAIGVRRHRRQKGPCGPRGVPVSPIACGSDSEEKLPPLNDPTPPPPSTQNEVGGEGTSCEGAIWGQRSMEREGKREIRGRRASYVLLGNQYWGWRTRVSNTCILASKQTHPRTPNSQPNLTQPSPIPHSSRFKYRGNIPFIAKKYKKDENEETERESGRERDR